MKKLLILALMLSGAFAFAKPGATDVGDFNDIINSNMKAESGLRKNVQDSSGYQKDEMNPTPSFKANKTTRDELSDNVAVSVEGMGADRKKGKLKKSLTTDEKELPRVSEEMENSGL